jgi:hypothetical protein
MAQNREKVKKKLRYSCYRTKFLLIGIPTIYTDELDLVLVDGRNFTAEPGHSPVKERAQRKSLM